MESWLEVCVKEYMIRRVAALAINLVLVSIFVFTMLRLVPGDAAAAILGVDATPENVAAFRERNGLTGSLVEQYFRWAGGVVTGDFGTSLRGGTSVTDDFISRLPVTLEIVFLSFTFTIIIGILTGVYSALRQNSVGDVGMRFFATLGLAVPNFLLLSLLLVVPARMFKYAPPFGATVFLDDPLNNLRLFVPPTLLLSIGAASVLMRFTRSGFLEVLRQDYIRTARSKGLSESTVTFRHAFKNALPPVLTLAGLQLGGLLGGSIILERVMSLPGLGVWALDAIQLKDYPIVMIVALYSAATLMLISLIIDLSYGWLDPRVRYS
jgi:peptide/nickel transport system permease protein